jgi:hypothetical protein
MIVLPVVMSLIGPRGHAKTRRESNGIEMTNGGKHTSRGMSIENPLSEEGDNKSQFFNAGYLDVDS